MSLRRDLCWQLSYILISCLISYLISGFAQAQPSGVDSVTTHEAPVQIAGETFQRIQFEGRDYFMKATRPGSALVEIKCRWTAPGSKAALETRALQVASRSQEFVDRLKDGCSPKQGVAPESFTFEQAAKTHRGSARGLVSSGSGPATSKSPEAQHLPADTDPHIVPDPIDPANEFPEARAK